MLLLIGCRTGYERWVRNEEFVKEVRSVVRHYITAGKSKHGATASAHFHRLPLAVILLSGLGLGLLRMLPSEI